MGCSGFKTSKRVWSVLPAARLCSSAPCGLLTSAREVDEQQLCCAAVNSFIITQGSQDTEGQIGWGPGHSELVGWQPCPWRGNWNWMVFKALSKPRHSMVPWLHIFMCCSALSFYICLIRGRGRRGRGGDSRRGRSGWSPHRVIRRGGGGGRAAGRGRSWESSTATSAGPWTAECSGWAPSRTCPSAAARYPGWPGNCPHGPAALPALLSGLAEPEPRSCSSTRESSLHWRARLLIALSHIHAAVPCPLSLHVYHVMGKKLPCYINQNICGLHNI